MDGLLVFGPSLQSALAGLHERVHPSLDLGLLAVVLAAHVHELALTSDQLKEYLHLPLRRPPLELLRLHRPSARTRVLYPVQSRRGGFRRSSQQQPGRTLRKVTANRAFVEGAH